MKYTSLTVACFILLFVLLASTTALTAPLEPGIGILGDFELGASFYTQIDNFYRRHPRTRIEAPIHKSGPDVVIQAFGLRFLLSPKSDLITAIICNVPSCHVPRYDLRVDDYYDMVSKRLGRPDRPYLKTPKQGIGMIWLYDYEGIGFEIDNDGYIRAIHVYPRRTERFDMR